MTSLDLKSDVKQLKGVGEALAKKLARLDVYTVSDLLHHYPRRYEDYSDVTPIAKLREGPVTIKGRINSVVNRRSRRGLFITEALITDSSGSLQAIWFNRPYLAQSLPKKGEIYASGKLELRRNRFSLQNPSIERVGDFTKNTARIVPVYPETKALTSAKLRQLISQALDAVSLPPDTIPPTTLEHLPGSKFKQSGSYSEALRQIHFPDSQSLLSAARRRLAFEELFHLILTGLVIKAEIKTEKARPVKCDVAVAREFVAALPFTLTDAQRKAAWGILQDMDSASAMNRLLEGDVGSGKTVVAALALLMVARQGYQAALMAPTSVLARQHFATVSAALKGSNVKLELLLGATKPKEKRLIKQRLATGESAIVIGTHSLLEPDLKFKSLNLVVIDEQHRFGVSQRQLLKRKAGQLPHLLTMTATPIPRSLALTVYGDLDISVIDQLPQNRKPVKTKVATDNERTEVYRHIENHIDSGSQVFVICPLISESDKLGVKSVEAEYQRLKSQVFAHRQIAMLHGKMKEDEKQAVMEEFRQGKADILVSTTVVEVGVDIPNATVMLIEAAERFGLAQLHQLRGRVGRGGTQAYCYLIATNAYQARHRLSLLERYSDGFVLAQKDLELRGPGEIYGQRQHGQLDLRLANLGDTELIRAARTAASAFLEQADLDRYPEVVSKINSLKTVTVLE